MEVDLDRSSAPENPSTIHPPPSRKSVHGALGGGTVADLMLWKRRNLCISLIVVASAVWFLFELAGYSLLSFVANVLMLLVVILFFWAKSASLLNRPLPPLPNLEVSDDCVEKAADAVRPWINRVLAVAHDIAIKRDVKLFFEVASGLWLVSYIGSLFNFLTFLYFGVLLSLTVPVFYDKYQEHVDDKLSTTQKVFLTQYRKIDNNILRRIPIPTKKEKKNQ